MKELLERRVNLADGRVVLYRDREDNRERVRFEHVEDAGGVLRVLVTTTEIVMSLDEEDALSISDDLKRESIAATYKPGTWTEVTVAPA